MPDDPKLPSQKAPAMKLNPNIALSESGFLFHASTGDSYTVNPTGLHILQLIRQERSIQEIEETLTETYDLGELQAKEDVHDYLQYLRQLKIVIDE
ncbi:MAG: HPr-rel-A system PqqD family peptide chaperone [Saprospiraceae bacterium]|nr:HPr-rel-A system PqqD family peptide chaperone [Saprospiraceae bacterium]MCB0679682.1 HPr-rel-A system PqqD family peptide chaperone [Saprospiraceae bacterium]